jgi:hypothetical protein
VPSKTDAILARQRMCIEEIHRTVQIISWSVAN